MRRPTPDVIAAAWVAACVLAGTTAGARQQDHYPETLRLRGEVLVEGGGPLAGARLRTDALRGPNANQIVAQKEFTTRPTFTLDQQLAAMDRSSGTSKVDGWFGQISDFMKATGAISTSPKGSEYITDAYMKRVKADPKLREFAASTK